MLVILCISACGGNNSSEEEPGHDHEHEGEVKVVANLRIGIEQHEGQLQYESAVRMAQEIEAKSEGAVKATVYGAGKLGTDEELLKYLETEEDAIDIVIASADAIAKYKAGFNAAELPFAMCDYDAVRDFVNGDVQRYAAQGLEENNMRALGYYMDGFHVLVCSEQNISKAETLQGTRVAVADEKLTAIAMRMMGAQIEECDYGQMNELLKRGRCEAAAGRIEDILERRVYQWQYSMVLTNHTLDLSGIVISEKLWSELDKQYQQIIQQAAINSSHYNIEEVRQADQKMIGQIEASGVRIVTPNPEGFWKKAEPAVRNYSSEFQTITDRLILWRSNRQ